ncbi:hypothetical protein [Actinokineospora sp.]|uniref:hypothetical protein n=1 Tax=Actinokineospora sp. TaxID=1872133 RepID=UPI004038091D
MTAILWRVVDRFARRRLAHVVTMPDVQRRALHTMTTRYRRRLRAVTITNGLWAGGGQVRLYSNLITSSVEWLTSLMRPAPTIAATPTPTPTATPKSTATPKPTATPKSTSTPTTAPTPTAPADQAAAPPTTPGFVGPEDRKDGAEPDEVNWTATDQFGGKRKPGPLACVHRSDNTPPETVFSIGYPPLPGNNFDLKGHQERSGERDGTGDGLYGGSVYALWGDNEGPLFESGGEYLYFLEDVWGVVVESQQYGQGFSVIEMESGFRTAPARKAICALNKRTGKVTANPNLPKERVEKQVARALHLYEIGKGRGRLPID